MDKPTDLGRILVNEQEAAHMFGMSRSWFQKQRTDGDGPPYIKLDHGIRYNVTELKLWFSERTKSTKAQGE